MAPPALTDPDPALRALAHGGRRRMLALALESERSASELADACGMTKPAASQHLKVLRAADLVAVRVHGTHRMYRARADRLAALRAYLDGFWSLRLDWLREAV